MKAHEAKSKITIWGSGNQKRSFVYVKDVAEGILDVTEKYAVGEPVNLSSQEEISINDLVDIIIESFGKKLEIERDLTKPEGYSRKKPDITLAKNKINWNPKYSLREGIKETIQWYLSKNNRERIL